MTRLWQMILYWLRSWKVTEQTRQRYVMEEAKSGWEGPTVKGRWNRE